MAAGTVVTVSPPDPDFAASHEGVTLAALGRMLAALTGYGLAGEYAPGLVYQAPVYFLPKHTLVHEEARALGIRGVDDLFGGVVPHALLATKVITHELVDEAAAAPEGWSPALARAVREAVLPGFTAFSLPDAFRAGVQLLAQGPVRLKDPQSAGGRGQAVIESAAQLERLLQTLESAALARHGLVLERDLRTVQTVSVGQIAVGGLVAAYHGRQRTTVDNDGCIVYGGSDLTVVRGDFATLLALELADEIRTAILQAMQYDRAAIAHPRMVLSRRNYDVAQGVDAAGRWYSGVLEQSWRAGGASGPELAALLMLRAEPTRLRVRVSSVEAFGSGLEPPPGALVHFQGVDRLRGPMTKYTLVHDDETAP
jgi:hypothetical protein